MEKGRGGVKNWDTNTHWAAGLYTQSCFVLCFLLSGFESASRDELPSRRTCFLCLTTTGYHPQNHLSCQDFEEKCSKHTPPLHRWPFVPDQRWLNIRFRRSWVRGYTGLWRACGPVGGKSTWNVAFAASHLPTGAFTASCVQRQYLKPNLTAAGRFDIIKMREIKQTSQSQFEFTTKQNLHESCSFFWLSARSKYSFHCSQ